MSNSIVHAEVHVSFPGQRGYVGNVLPLHTQWAQARNQDFFPPRQLTMKQL